MSQRLAVWNATAVNSDTGTVLSITGLSFSENGSGIIGRAITVGVPVSFVLSGFENHECSMINPISLGNFEQIPDRDLNVVHPSSPSVRIGNFVYVITGESESLGVFTSDIERAEILGNGEISPWIVVGNLPSSRSQAVAAATESNIYVLGDHPGVTSVDRVPVLPDGSLGATVPERSMITARLNGGAIVHDGYLHVIGGSDNGASPPILNAVERALINPDGSLGPWEVGPSLNVRRTSFGLVKTQTYVWAISGGTVDATTETIERAKLLPDGALGPWELVSATVAGRSDVTALLVGSCIFLVGGGEVGSPGATDQVDCIRIDENEDIVEVIPQPELTLRRSAPAVFTDQSFLFVTGGALFEPGPGLTGWVITERAPILDLP